MSKSKEYDLIVIGGGSAANTVAKTCAKAKWSVASIEALPYGGTCPLRGCDPKKMLVAVTESLDLARRMSGKGMAAQEMRLDWSEMQAFKRSFTEAMPAKVKGSLEEAGVVTIKGRARFLGPDLVSVNDQEIRAKHICIATGARPATLDIPGEKLLATSTDFLELARLPERIAFVGGGFISFEFAHIAKRAGAREVTIVHRDDHPLGAFDPELVSMLIARTRELGIDVRLDTSLEALRSEGSEVLAKLSGTNSEALRCELVVHGAGRVANLDGLDLDRAEIEHSKAGIKVNGSLRSESNPRVFAAGDCADTKGAKLTPLASYEGEVVAANLLAGEDRRKVEYPAIPSIVFTLPPVGRVGLLECEAREQDLQFEVRHEKTDNWYSSMRVGETHTAFKSLVERGTGKLLGLHVIGSGAEQLLNIAAVAMKAGMSADELKATIFSYPSYASDLDSML